MKNIVVGNIQKQKNFYMQQKLVSSNEEFSFHLLSENEVYNILRSINSKAVGNDKISIVMLKLCCPFIIKYMTHIINSCLLENYFPPQWKVSLVTPLPKVNNPQS